MLYATNYGVPAVSLRFFTVYGPKQRPDMGFHRFIRAALTGQPITLYGDGEQTRDFTFVDDIVSALIAAGERGRAGGVYNIGGGSRVSINEVLAIIERITGRPLDIRREARRKRATCATPLQIRPGPRLSWGSCRLPHLNRACRPRPSGCRPCWAPHLR